MKPGLFELPAWKKILLFTTIHALCTVTLSTIFIVLLIIGRWRAIQTNEYGWALLLGGSFGILLSAPIYSERRRELERRQMHKLVVEATKGNR